MDLRDLDVIIQNINRIDCPIILDTTTEAYIRYAEQYYRALPVDWISCALKPLEKMAEMHKNFDRQKNQQNAIFGAVDTHRSCNRKWARRDLNSRPTGYQPVAPTDLSYGPRCWKGVIRSFYKNVILTIMFIILIYTQRHLLSKWLNGCSLYLVS